MDKYKLTILVLVGMLIATISYSVAIYKLNKKFEIGATMAYGNIGRYMETPTAMSTGEGTALITDNVGKLIISPSTTINIIGQ